MELVTIPAIRGLVNLILEAQSLGQCIQHIYGEPLVAFGLSKNVLSHHHKRLFLRTIEHMFFNSITGSLTHIFRIFLERLT
jgi:hypothetical protein